MIKFGKKLASKSKYFDVSSKTVVKSKKKMYALRESKKGVMGVVVVVSVKTKGKNVRVFKSDGLKLTKKVRIFRLKRLANKALSKVKKSEFGLKKKSMKKSSFGKKKASFGKKMKKSSFGKKKASFGKQPSKATYGFTVCKVPGDEKFKICKFYPRRWENQTYRIVKMKAGDGHVFYKLPEAARGFMVRNAATLKSSKAKAKLLAEKYNLLSHIDIDLTLVMCNNGEVGKIVSSLPKKVKGLSLNSTNKKMIAEQAGNMSQGVSSWQASKIRDNIRQNAASQGFFNVVNRRSANASRGMTGTLYPAAVEKTMRAENREFNKDPLHFGRNVNYGFSKYF